MAAIDDLPTAISDALTEVGPVAWPDGLGAPAYDSRFVRLTDALTVATGNDDVKWTLYSEHALYNALKTDNWEAEGQALRGRLLRTAALLCVWIDQIDTRFPEGS